MQENWSIHPIPSSIQKGKIPQDLRKPIGEDIESGLLHPLAGRA
jgi:hypothetical protein